jgi:hypothetical protein
MIDQKVAIITIHDVDPSHSEKILKTCYELKAENQIQFEYCTVL